MTTTPRRGIVRVAQTWNPVINSPDFTVMAPVGATFLHFAMSEATVAFWFDGNLNADIEARRFRLLITESDEIPPHRPARCVQVLPFALHRSNPFVPAFLYEVDR